MKEELHIPLWLLILCLALIFVIIGVVQGDLSFILRKATLICYECIGIG